METLTIGVSGNKLANKDFFSKSDPYLVISRPVPGGWNPLRSSETIKDNLNPVWRNFVLNGMELPRNGDKFRFEVFDDDGRHGRDSSDDSIGVGYFSIEQLEEAFHSRVPLTIRDKIWGKDSGQLIITELKKSESSSVSTYPLNKSLSQSTSTTSKILFTSGASSAGGFVVPGRI